MKKYFFLLLLCLPHISHAEKSYSDIWRIANTFYSQKAYDSAAVYYERLAALQPGNAEVYYNLGNTYYKLNEVGPAVLSYQRTLRIDPSYQPAKDNLYLTESRIANRIQGDQDIFFLRWWKNMSNPSMEDNWAVAALVLFLICLSVLVLRRWSKVVVPPQVALLAGILSFFCLCLSYVAASDFISHPDAVVMTTDAPMVESIKASKASSLIPEGTVVRIEQEQGSKVEVKLPDGRTGWMDKQNIQKI